MGRSSSRFGPFRSLKSFSNVSGVQIWERFEKETFHNYKYELACSVKVIVVWNVSARSVVTGLLQCPKQGYGVSNKMSVGMTLQLMRCETKHILNSQACIYVMDGIDDDCASLEFQSVEGHMLLLQLYFLMSHMLSFPCQASDCFLHLHLCIYAWVSCGKWVHLP